MAKCRFCQREITWALDAKGSPIPLEKFSVYRVWNAHTYLGDDVPAAIVNKARSKEDGAVCALQPHGSFMVNHWATCPEREAAAKERDAKQAAQKELLDV